MLKNKPQPRRGASAGATKSLGMAGKALGRKTPLPITSEMQKQIRNRQTMGLRGTPQGAGRLGAIGSFNKAMGTKAPVLGAKSAQPTMTKSKGPGGLTRLTRRGMK
jgi:hypothetical protein